MPRCLEESKEDSRTPGCRVQTARGMLEPARPSYQVTGASPPGWPAVLAQNRNQPIGSIFAKSVPNCPGRVPALCIACDAAPVLQADDQWYLRYTKVYVSYPSISDTKNAFEIPVTPHEVLSFVLPSPLIVL